MTDQTDPFEIFREASPLATVETDSLDEFLSRINDDLVADMSEKITDERLGKLVEMYRTQAIGWEIKQQEKPARKTPGERKKSIKEALDLDLDIQI